MAGKKAKSRYDRNAAYYDLMQRPSERCWFRKWRSEIFSPFKGLVLEVGAGTGANLPFYSENAEVIGIDISGKMLQRAKNKIGSQERISLIQMDGERLAFPDETFDYVVTTFVLCSVPDPIAALGEMKRVCKRTGEIVNMEHVRSENSLVALMQDLVNPVTVRISGVNVNRDTRRNIEASGLRLLEDRELAMRDIFRLFRSSQLMAGKT